MTRLPRRQAVAAGLLTVAVILSGASVRAASGRGSSRSSQAEVIAFVRGSTDIHGDLIGDIYLMNGDGTGMRRLTRNRYDDSQPSWSPDGRRIVFHSERDLGARGFYPGLFVMDADGSNQRRLTRGGEIDPAWSPDGNRIAFVRSIAPPRAGSAYQREIFVMNADGTRLRRLTRNPTDDSFPAWSPDGHNIAFTRTGDIYVMNANGTNQRRLTRTAVPEDEPAWSPDGSKIAFASTVPGSANSTYLHGDVYVVNADGSNRRRVTKNRRPETKPAWSPDGSQIAFDRGLESSTATGYVLESEIYVMNADGSDQHPLTHKAKPNLQILNVQPAWQPTVR